MGERESRGEVTPADEARGAKLAGAANLAAAADAVEPLAPTDSAALGPGSAWRAVFGRVFVLRGRVWTDALHRDTVQVTPVAPFSAAHFALVRALPEIVPWLAPGPEVLITGRRASIRIGADGTSEWHGGQLARLARDFGGT
jgi:hypothetical protein